MASGSWSNGSNGSGTWDVTNGVLTISGTGKMTDYGYSSNPPWQSYSSSITTIKIGSGITYIGDSSFAYLSNATSASMADTVTIIGDDAFYNCTALTSIKLSNSLTVIWSAAFYNCTALTSIIIPASVTTFHAFIFRYCTALTSITFLSSSAPPTLNTNSLSVGKSSQPVTITVYTNGGWGSDDVFTESVRGGSSNAKYTTFTYEKLVTVNVNVNVGGTWKPSVPYVNVGGTWKEVVGVYVNVNGTWKEAV